MPERWQVMSKLANLLALRGAKQKRRRFGQQGVLSLQLFHLSQLLIPLPFQAPGHEAVLRDDRFVPTPGQARSVLPPLNLPFPLVIALLGSCFPLPPTPPPPFPAALPTAPPHPLYPP